LPSSSIQTATGLRTNVMILPTLERVFECHECRFVARDTPRGNSA
jgi:hypothetical protein